MMKLNELINFFKMIIKDNFYNKVCFNLILVCSNFTREGILWFYFVNPPKMGFIYSL